ncbi:hypothetical protein EGI31_22550 [Lacihabitans soyangensis]|uniref:Uncharacterized protein n=1 Tax=Lacihabitans soyangensis TaxID=869394 RepID=A0AAE3H7Q2_9BACT|nr:hypothetical protein [Lacihabitans soyangensis]
MKKYKFVIPILMFNIFLLFSLIYSSLNDDVNNDGLGVFIVLNFILIFFFNLYGIFLIYVFKRTSNIFSYILYLVLIFCPIILVFYPEILIKILI